VALAPFADTKCLPLSPGPTVAVRGSAFESLEQTVTDYIRSEHSLSGGFNQIDLSLDGDFSTTGLVHSTETAQFSSGKTVFDVDCCDLTDFTGISEVSTGLTPAIIDDCGVDVPLSPIFDDFAAQMPPVEPFQQQTACPEVTELLSERILPSPEPETHLQPSLEAALELPNHSEVKKRKKQVKVPENRKDAKYHAYRNKNTKKAKACRDRKREEKKLKIAHLEAALARNSELRARAERLEILLAKLQRHAPQRSLPSV